MNKRSRKTVEKSDTPVTEVNLQHTDQRFQDYPQDRFTKEGGGAKNMCRHAMRSRDPRMHQLLQTNKGCMLQRGGWEQVQAHFCAESGWCWT